MWRIGNQKSHNMKTKTVILFFLLLSTLTVCSQTIVFDKFKMEPALVGKSLRVKYICNTEYTIKYITVYFTILNAVGDEEADIHGIKELHFKCTGPIYGKKKYKEGYSVFVSKPLPLTPKPKRIEIEYMDDSVEDETIQINDDNLKTYFPKWKLEDKW